MSAQRMSDSLESIDKANHYDDFCCFHESKNHRFRVFWEITRTCNLNCRFCFAAVDGRDLADADLLKLAYKMIDNGVRDVVISGGEPLCRSATMDIISCLRKAGVEVDICTNGTLIDRPVAHGLAEHLTEISVSLHGASPELHDGTVGRIGAWHQTIQGISHLRSCGLAVHVIVVLTRATLVNMVPLLKVCEQLDVRSLSFLGAMDVDSQTTGMLSRDDRRAAYRLIQEQREKWNGQLTINTKRVLLAAPLGHCQAGRAFLAVDAHGRLLPCIFWARIAEPWPNLMDTSFSECMTELKNLWLETVANRPSTCGHCLYVEGCGQGCPGAGVIAYGCPAADPLCPLLKPTGSKRAQTLEVRRIHGEGIRGIPRDD